MLPQSFPDFDLLGDYDHPDQTETRFRGILLQFPEDDPAFPELLTQIARAQGLQLAGPEAAVAAVMDGL